MDRRCLLVGCGYTGRRLARRLRPGWRVSALARSDAAAERLVAEGIVAERADLDLPLARGELIGLGDGSAVVYLVPPPDGGTTDPRIERFLASLGDAVPTSLVYVSTTGVYGDTGGALVTEASTPAPGSERAGRRLAAERAVESWSTERGVRSVILRVPGIYGPGRLPIERLRRGEPALEPADAGPGNRIHVDDLVEVCAAAIERPVSGIFNVTDGDPSSTTVFLQRTAAIAGLPPPPLVSLAQAAGRISPGMLAFLVESRRVDNRRMREVLGVVPRYSRLDDGIRASLEEMQSMSA